MNETALPRLLEGALVTGSLALVAAMATAVVLTRDPSRQAIVLSGYGVTLGLLFVVLQAPDVAMSQFGVGTVVVPLIVILALHAARRHSSRHPARHPARQAEHDPGTPPHRQQSGRGGRAAPRGPGEGERG